MSYGQNGFSWRMAGHPQRQQYENMLAQNHQFSATPRPHHAPFFPQNIGVRPPYIQDYRAMYAFYDQNVNRPNIPMPVTRPNNSTIPMPVSKSRPNISVRNMEPFITHSQNKGPHVSHPQNAPLMNSYGKPFYPMGQSQYNMAAIATRNASNLQQNAVTSYSQPNSALNTTTARLQCDSNKTVTFESPNTNVVTSVNTEVPAKIRRSDSGNISSQNKGHQDFEPQNEALIKLLNINKKVMEKMTQLDECRNTRFPMRTQNEDVASSTIASEAQVVLHEQPVMEVSQDSHPSQSPALSANVKKRSADRVAAHRIHSKEKNESVAHNVESSKTSAVVNESSAKAHACTVCRKSFASETSLRKHRDVHDPNRLKPYECHYCAKKITRKSHLLEHLKVHNDEKDYICDYCHTPFVAKSNLKKHIATVHMKITSKCPLCEKEFLHIRLHLVTCSKRKIEVERLNSRFPCTVCDEKFSSERMMNEHRLLTHKTAHRYACPVCKAGFTTTHGLQQHLRDHKNCSKCCLVCWSFNAFCDRRETLRKMALAQKL